MFLNIMAVMRILLLLLGILTTVSTAAQNGKKVYADYHGVRYTRLHDGKLGRWQMYANTEKSVTGRKTLCYNADLIDENGRHDIAAVAYPQTGLQSDLDSDYIEYQILLAKAAKIDGFFIEWGFKPHENDVLLRTMQQVAAKYDFEIGVNWCDGWLYYDWITKVYPEVNTREAKTKYMVKCYQYLVDNVFTGKTALTVKGHPVIYQFGGNGATVDEYRLIMSQVRLPQGMKQPAVLRRWADWGRLENDRYIPVVSSADMETWKGVGIIPTAWLPARVRVRDAEHSDWDNYAVSADVIEFMKPFRDSVWNVSNPSYTIKSGFAMPGMDNRGCAGWGRSHFYFISRENGDTYRDMWNFCMQSKDSLDMMFIASWSDYTEGHEIAPTIENGDRELRTTLKYASLFKNEAYDEQGLSLPLALFRLRKDVHLLDAVGIDVSAFNNALDKAASLISNSSYAEAENLLNETSEDILREKSSLQMQMMRLREPEIDIKGHQTASCFKADNTVSITLSPLIIQKLQKFHYSGYIYFEYMDKGHETLFVRSLTKCEPKNMFNVVGSLRTDDTGEWKKAKMELYKENIVYGINRPTFYLKGNVLIRNISLGYTLYLH